jgi:hypothetical protein
MASGHVARVAASAVPGLHRAVGHEGFRQRQRVGRGYDDCHLQRLTEPGLLY